MEVESLKRLLDTSDKLSVSDDLSNLSDPDEPDVVHEVELRPEKIFKSCGNSKDTSKDTLPTSKEKVLDVNGNSFLVRAEIHSPVNPSTTKKVSSDFFAKFAYKKSSPSPSSRLSKSFDDDEIIVLSSSPLKQPAKSNIPSSSKTKTDAKFGGLPNKSNITSENSSQQSHQNLKNCRSKKDGPNRNEAIEKTKGSASKCKVNSDWFENADEVTGQRIKTWGEKTSRTEVFCKVCRATISVAAKGLQALLQHAGTKKHVSHVTIKKDNQQTVFLPTGDPDSNQKQLTSFTSSELARRAEVIWTMKVVESNYSARSCDNIKEIFDLMFPNMVPEQFSLAKTKASYLMTESVAPYFKNLMLSDVKDKFYSILYDETTNNNGGKDKELKVLIRFWSTKISGAVTRHLESFFIRSATGDIIFNHIREALDNANLPLSKILMLGRDGPNVNKTVFNLLEKEVKKERGKGMVDTGTCNLHTVDNGFKKGLDSLGINADELVSCVYYFFHKWPVRQEDFAAIQIKLGLPGHYFIKHVSSRWLTLELGSNRVLEQWEALEFYFIKFIPKEKKELENAKNYAKICRLLKNPTMKAELLFVTSSAEIFCSFSRLFQTEESLIHLLYDELKKLILILSTRVCKQEVLINFNSVDLNDPFKRENIMSDSAFETALPSDVKLALQKVSGVNKTFFLNNAKNHYIEAGKHLIKKCPIVGKNLKSFGFLQPKNMLDWSWTNVKKVAQVLPSNIDPDKLRDEYMILQVDLKSSKDLKKFQSNSVSVKEFWKSVMSEKNIFGNPKYPILTEVYQLTSSLSHGNADAERDFSISKNILMEDRTAMSVKALNARLFMRDGIKSHGKIQNVAITKELIKSAESAYSQYKAHLEDEAEKRKKKSAEEEIARQRKKEEEEALEKISESKKKLKDLEKDLASASKSEKEQRMAANQMLDEANLKLKKATAVKDFVSLEMAQAMLDAASKLSRDAAEKEKATNGLRRKVEKRRKQIVDSLEAKKFKI